MTTPDHKFSVAPLMDWTDRHCRAFHRVLTRRARLYTEMVTADAIIHGDRERLIGFSDMEHPVAIQLGAASRRSLRKPRRSPLRAAMMRSISMSAAVGPRAIRALRRVPDARAGFGGRALERDAPAAPDVPVTIKCRIGVDEQEPRKALFELVERASAEGCRTFIVHARKAWLKGFRRKRT